MRFARCRTQGGKATAVLQSLASYEQTQASLALLRIVALGGVSLIYMPKVPVEFLGKFRVPRS